MSLWEFVACERGYEIANDVEEEVTAPTRDEFYGMLERLN